MKTILKFVGASTFIGIVLWLVDTCLDSLYFYSDLPFFDLLILNVPPHELYIRSIIVISFLLFGFFMGRLQVHLNKKRDDLIVAAQHLTAREQKLTEANTALTERVKELKALYSLSQITTIKNVTISEILQKAVNLIPPAWQYPAITCGRIYFDGQEIVTDNFKKTKWIQSADLYAGEKKTGVVEVYYLAERPTIDEGPFLQEERDLINTFTKQLGLIIERTKAEKECITVNQQLRSSEQQLQATTSRDRTTIANQCRRNAASLSSHRRWDTCY